MMESEDEKQPLLKQNGVQASSSYDGEKTPLVQKKEAETKSSASLAQLFREATCFDIFLIFVGTLAAMVHGAGWPVLFIFFGDMTDTFVQGERYRTIMVLLSVNVFILQCIERINAGYSVEMGTQTVPVNLTVNNTLLDDFNEKMTRYSIYYVYVGAAVFVSSYIQVTCWTTACERQVHRMRLHFFSAILRQEIGWFDVHQSGELTARLADDLERVKEGIGDKFSYAIQFFSQFVAGFVIGFIHGWKMALVMMSLTPLLAVAGGFMARLMTTFSKQEQTAYASAGSVAEEVLSCIRTVTSFNGQAQDIKRYKEKLEESKAIGIKKSWISGVGIGFTFLTMFSAYALAFWYGTEQVKDWYSSGFEDGISPGTVLTVFFCVLVGTFSIGNITPHMTSVAAAKGAAAVLIGIIDNKPSIDSSSKGGRSLTNVQGNIVFKNVDFTYPTREEVQVLKNFNMEVRPGQTVALVGPSGCGKSTTINLIQRFYDPNAGTVSIDGTDIREFNIKSLRENIGVVSQEPILFGMSIEDNILLGNPNASMDQIVEAARSANCHDFISKLPKGYKTLVGERGAQLSGGQKQRVAIARALIRNPKILLLDEATSALDTQSERIVQAALDKAREGRTTIVIAHRLSTIQNADMIYVVKDGVIVEMGKHGDLMAMQGEYHQLVTVQMLVENEQQDEDADEAVDNIDDLREQNGHAGVPRKRTISDSKTGRQISHQISKPQVSRTDSKNPEQAKDEEKETAERAKFCPMLRENKPEWPFIVIGCCAAAVNGCTMPAFAMFFGEMIQVFQNKGENSLLWSMMFLVLGGVQFMTNTIQTVSFGHSGEKMTMRLRLKTFTAMLRQDISYFDDPRRSTGALTMRLATDATMVKTATGIRIASMLQALFGVVAALVIAFIYGWQLALVVLGGVPLMAIAGALQLKTVMGNQKKDSVEMEQAGKTASESIENIRTVQSLTREPYFYQKYLKFLTKPHVTNMKLAQLTGVTYGFSQGIVFMIYAGAFRFGAYMVTEGQMNSADVFKVFFAISLTGLVVGQVSSFLPDYSKAAFSAGIIFKVLGTIPPIDVYSKKGTYPSKLAGTIEFKNVHFNYPTRPDVPVLKGINIKVDAGQTVALVGPSGCGKSTVVSLIQRFYDPSQGSVEVDGMDIRDINLIRLRHLISVVSQEPILFDCSIKDNITYGLDNQIGMDEIISVARAANIHNFIADLPMGYETVVGEKGTQLSGGQKQRVAIARALIRNPRILLLDEATSALDTESEKLVQAALDNAQEGRTCIVIAHRLSTIQNADVIYVIDSGSVVEYGNHQQLLNKHGVYAQLVSGQQLSKT